MILTEVNFASEALSMRATLYVLLPQQPGARRTFPALYLLHGHSDDHTAWLRWTSVERYAEARGLAVVMPNVHRSYYTDMVHGGRYFTFIAEEVPALLRNIFPISPARQHTFVAGLSMGGYGAFKLALTYPNRYAAAASLSGVLDIAASATQGDDERRANMRRIFGDPASLPNSPHDLFALAKKAARRSVRPRLFQYCGRNDGFYADNLRFRDALQALNYPPTYHEDDGDHSWAWWDSSIQDVITWLPLED